MKVDKKPRNRNTRTHLIFNEEARRDFLKGFKKRKDERRRKAREKMEIQLKEEKKRLKDEHRNSLKKYMQTQRTVPEVEHILKPVVYDLPNHVVTVSTSTDVDLAGHDNLRLGLNKIINEKSKVDDENDLDQTECDSVVSKNALKKSNKIIEKSKAFQMKQKLKQKKDRQKRRVQQMRNKHCKTKKRNIMKNKNLHE